MQSMMQARTWPEGSYEGHHQGLRGEAGGGTISVILPGYEIALALALWRPKLYFGESNISVGSD